MFNCLPSFRVTQGCVQFRKKFVHNDQFLECLSHLTILGHVLHSVASVRWRHVLGVLCHTSACPGLVLIVAETAVVFGGARC